MLKLGRSSVPRSVLVPNEVFSFDPGLPLKDDPRGDEDSSFVALDYSSFIC